MKTVILHNVNINNFSNNDEIYLIGGRVTFAITDKVRNKNTVFLMWDDRKWVEEKQAYDEKLSPRPFDRINDFIGDIWEGSDIELKHLQNHISHMNCCQTIHYDMESFRFI